MRDMNTYLTFYHKCLHADLHMMPFSEMPAGQMPPGSKDRVMHARLQKGTVTLMASDAMPGHPFKQGNNFSISINCESKNEVDELSNALKEGGQVTMANQDMFWGAYFGMVTDKFGVSWMFNCELSKVK
jgi:PhnB protein